MVDHNPSLECDDHGAIVDRILQITSIVHCVLVLAVFFFSFSDHSDTAYDKICIVCSDVTLWEA